MCRKSHSRGFTLVTAIFLIVVMGALSAYLVSLTTLTLSASQLDVLGARAYQAARAGAEWAAFEVLTPVASAPPACPASPTHLSGLGGTLAPFIVSVECAASGPETEGDRNLRTYRIAVTACNEPEAGSCINPASRSARYVQRRVELVLSRCNNPNAGPRFLC